MVAVGGLLAVPVLSSTGGGPVFLTALTVWGAVLGLSWAVGNRTGRVRRPEPRPPAAAPEERRVTADMLDAPAREPLRRTQEEVDAVLDSPLHHRGLLLDGTRDRVVLADVEGAVAESPLRRSGARRRIDTTPTPGERSRAAAEQARAVLEQDVVEVTGRIELPESYAARVRAAALEEQDRRAAAAPEAVAVDVAGAGAAHPHRTEALACPVDAPEFALRVASRTDPDR